MSSGSFWEEALHPSSWDQQDEEEAKKKKLKVSKVLGKISG